MLLILLGLFDILAGLMLFTLKFKILSIAWFFVIYLMVKPILFVDITSLIDLIAGIFIVLAIYGYYSIFTWILILWLIQKGGFSVLGSL